VFLVANARLGFYQHRPFADLPEIRAFNREILINRLIEKAAD